MSLTEQLAALDWLQPWTPTSDDFGAELARETGRGHPLAGRKAIAIGRRLDADDVLFWLPEGPSLLASVHLTWSGERERRPEWPAARLYASLDEWVEAEMMPDHAEWQGGR